MKVPTIVNESTVWYDSCGHRLGNPMVRYFFHIRDGWDLIPDEEGIEFATWNAALREARASANDLGQNIHSRVYSIHIADRDGNVLGSVPIAA